MKNKPGDTVWIDRGILFCLSVLIFILPMSHTTSIQAFAFYIPFALLICRFLLNRDFRWIKTNFELPFIAFFLAAATSVATSHLPRTSLAEIWKNLLVPILFFYVTYYSVRKESDGLLLVKVFLLANFIFSIYSFYQFKMHDGTWLIPTYRAEGVKGACEANGLYNVMITPFIFWGLFYFKKYRLKSMLIILLIINLLALHITFTRATYLALGMQMLLAAVLLISRKRWLSGLIIFILLISAGSLYVEEKIFREMHIDELPSLQEYFTLRPEKIVGSSPTSASERLAMWKAALDVIAREPFYPHGYGRFNFGQEVLNEKNRKFIYPHVHNTFISTAFELGVQGLVIFLWMIGTFIVVAWKYWRKSTIGELSHFLSAALLAMMAAYWVDNFFQSIDADDIKRLFMMMLGIGMAVLHRLPKEEENSQTTGKTQQ